MARPAYLRTSSENSFPSATDSREEDDFETAGLRKRPLVALFVCLGILAILATFLLIMNIMLIVSLQMDRHGMKFIRFHTVFNSKTGENEKIVKFNGNNIDLGSVQTDGFIYGYPNQDLNIYGSRVLTSATPNGTKFILQNDGCKLQNAENFQVESSATGRPMFNAQHPLVQIDKKIKKISTSKIITNKIRSPIDENLRIDVENLSIRGNEGIRLEGSNIRMRAATMVNLNTSHDGSIHFAGGVRLGTSSRGLPLSPSPALSASIDAFRVCVCGGPKPKLYLTPGNKPCQASNIVC